MELPQFVGTYLCDPLINLGITNAEKCTGWFISEVVLGTVFAWFFLQWIYVKLISKEHTNIPVLNVEVPKVAGGYLREGQQVLEKDKIITYNPATLEILGTAPVFTPEQVAEAVKKAKVAQQKWKTTSFAERRRVLRTLLQHLVTHQREMSELSLKETGKTAIDSIFGEIFMSCEKLRWVINNGERFLKREYRATGFNLHKQAYIDYVPYGVIGIIIPWNFPIHNALSHITTALMTGNGAVVKVSEWSSWSVSYLQKMTDELLTKTGHSPDLIKFVTGYGETGGAVVSNVDKVLFIGSPQIGKKVMEAASRTLTPVTLELGGKDPFIICEDADLDYAVDMALRGAFLNCGQNCLSAERFYVYDKIYDEFVKRVTAKMPSITQGPTSPDVGAINLPSQLTKYAEFIADATAKGAKVLSGGKVNSQHKGQFFEPTVLINVNHSMKTMQEETFGPVMSVMRVSSDEEVIRLMNDCSYGLSCSIFSKNYKRAHKIAEQVRAGSVIINDWGLAMLIQDLPIGGVSISGFGKFQGPEGLRDFCFQRGCVTDRFGIAFPPPKPLMYPSSARVHELVATVLTIIYDIHFTRRVSATLSLLKKIITRDV